MTEIGDSEPRPSSRSRDWAALAVLLLVFAGLFALDYPPLPGIEDEVGFVNQALVWSRGAISSEGAGLPVLGDFIAVGGRHVAARHPGRSLAALPFLVLGGVPAVFMSGLVLHLVLTLLAAALLARLGRSPLWAVLVLFHPTLAIYSRTVMADASAGTGLLLAALAFTSASPLAGLGAGLAVGLAAAMRYHAALALPVVALAFLLPPRRTRPWRDAALCMLGGLLGGASIVAYNLAVYGAPVEPFTGSRGYFAVGFVVPHGLFYLSALLAIWPGMLLAPVLDRSPIRWVVRGVCGLFLVFLTPYYFHDRGPGWLETLVVGQRLLQVALPLWIVSYAGMLDAWVAEPIRRRLGDRVWLRAAALGCAGLVAATAAGFERHQRHLAVLLEAQRALTAHVPGGSLIVFEGPLPKLTGIPTEIPAYRLRPLTYEGQPAEDLRTLFGALGREENAWYLAVLDKGRGGAPSTLARAIVERWGLERLPVQSPVLSLYIHRGGASSLAAAPMP